MLELHVDEDALENAGQSLCFKCGSTRIVSSATIIDPAQNPSLVSGGWVCKQCHDELVRHCVEHRDTGVLFGEEGFLSDNFTIYDEMEIVQKVKEFNQQFEDKGSRARLFSDWDWYFRMEVIVDDDQPELADAVKEAENMHKLCRNNWVPFSRRRH